MQCESQTGSEAHNILKPGISRVTPDIYSTLSDPATLSCPFPEIACFYAVLPQQFLYFFPLPHVHGSLRPTFGASLRWVGMTSCSSSPFSVCCSSRGALRFSRLGIGPPTAGRAGAEPSIRCPILKGREERNCSNAIKLVVLRNKFDKTSLLMLAINALNML